MGGGVQNDYHLTCFGRKDDLECFEGSPMVMAMWWCSQLDTRGLRNWSWDPQSGKGTEELKPLWPIREEDLLILRMSLKIVPFFRREVWFWYRNLVHKKEAFMWVTCFGFLCGSIFLLHWVYLLKMEPWELMRTSLSSTREPQGSQPAQTPGTSTHSEPHATPRLHRCWANNSQ